MNVLAVDDESISLECLSIVLNEMSEIENVHTFSDADSTLNWIKSKKEEANKIDIAFLDIEMWGKNGLFLASEIRKFLPQCKIIFVTCNPKYAIDAFQMHANGYIVKPATAESIRKELDFLKNNMQFPEDKNQTEKLRVQCFGNFEVFYKGHNVKFGLSKSKELLAYLVHKKGSSCSTSEIASVLFENRTDNDSLQSQVRNMISNLKKSLEAVGLDPNKLLIKTRGYIAINTDEILCDFYDFLNGDPASINYYNGEYMSQYSWSEFTIGYLERQLNR
ncbi:MAG: response regulator [Treponema sp.]|nr:response regulator [Treponema sp.]